MTKILIVESNNDNLTLMIYLLNHYGFSTVSAIDGEEGVKMAKREKPDLIICDIELPKMNGFDMVKLLKKDDQLNKIPVVAVTAYAMLGDRHKIRAAGFDAYIAKPIIPTQFVTQIETLLPEELRSNKQLRFQPGYELALNQTDTGEHGVALVVDNFSANAELSKYLLESIGIHAITVQSVKEAIDVLQKTIPDLILSDLNFPESSGVEFLKLIRENKRWELIPFVITSATSPTEQERNEIRKLDIKRFILLPINSDDFVGIIQNIYGAIKKVHSD